MYNTYLLADVELQVIQLLSHSQCLLELSCGNTIQVSI